MTAPRPGPALVTAALTLAFGAAVLAVDPGFFWRDDYQAYQLAGYLDAAAAWRSGELPLASRSTWFGGALAGEYQNAVFSPAVMLPVIALREANASLTTTATALSLGHLVVLAVGCCLLARQRRLPADLCVLVGLIGALNGYQLVYGAMCWFPQLASFAWVPWAWWALERAMRRPGPAAWLPAAIFLALILTAGWPFSAAMIGLVTLMLAARHGSRRGGVRRLLCAGAAWAVALCLSAPAWLALLGYAGSTLRSQVSPLSVCYDWRLSPRHLPALIFPAFRTPLDQDVGPSHAFNAELAGGLVPLVVLLACRWAYGDWKFLARFRGEKWLLIAALLLAMLPSVGPFRWSFRWLALAFLAGGLVAAAALERLRRRPPAGGRPNLGLWALACVAGVSLYALVRQPDPTPFTAAYAACTAALCLAWSGIDRWLKAQAPLRRFAPALVAWAALLAFAVGMAPRLYTPCWPVERTLSDWAGEPGVRYLSAYTWDDIVGEDYSRRVGPVTGRGVALLPCNMASYVGADVVQGYSPMQPLGLKHHFGFESHGQIDPGRAADLLRDEAGPGGLLDRMAIDGVVFGDSLTSLAPSLEAAGWRRAGPRTYRRPGPPSARVRVLRGESAPADVAEIREGRNRVSARVTPSGSDGEAVILFSRAWYPGYEARLDGESVAVEVIDRVMPAVRLPAGRGGELVLEYRPGGVRRGGLLALAAVGAMIAAVAWGAARRATAGRD